MVFFSPRGTSKVRENGYAFPSDVKYRIIWITRRAIYHFSCIGNDNDRALRSAFSITFDFAVSKVRFTVKIGTRGKFSVRRGQALKSPASRGKTLHLYVVSRSRSCTPTCASMQTLWKIKYIYIYIKRENLSSSRRAKKKKGKKDQKSGTIRETTGRCLFESSCRRGVIASSQRGRAYQ